MSMPQFQNIRSDTPIIGLTGALGSGCSFLAKGLAEFHQYKHCKLSGFIHAAAKKMGLEENTANLQDIGDAMRRNYKRDVLVRYALEQADGTFKHPDKGIVIDGIRNAGEVDALRSLPYFFLISVQAEDSMRQARLLGAGKFKTADEFHLADQRDADEGLAHGQQVTRCSDIADIVVLNETETQPRHAGEFRKYVDNTLYDKFVAKIEALANGTPFTERTPGISETMMTLAHSMSARSRCLKRKVGAIITTDKGQVIAAGYNDVADEQKSCLAHAEYGGCARDQLQERIATQIHYCAHCGAKLQVSCRCVNCGKSFDSVLRQCTKCQADTQIDANCKACGMDVFAEFLPGYSRKTGKLLDLCRALHAEENAILSAARNGPAIPTGAILYCTTYPCNLCANKIVNAGIRRVYYSEPYDMPEAKKVFEAANVVVTRFEGVKSTAYFRLFGQGTAMKGAE